MLVDVVGDSFDVVSMRMPRWIIKADTTEELLSGKQGTLAAQAW